MGIAAFPCDAYRGISRGRDAPRHMHVRHARVSTSTRTHNRPDQPHRLQIPDRSRVFHVRTPHGPDGAPMTGSQLHHRDLRDMFAPVGPLLIRAMGKHEAFIVFQNTADPPPETATLKSVPYGRCRCCCNLCLDQRNVWT